MNEVMVLGSGQVAFFGSMGIVLVSACAYFLKRIVDGLDKLSTVVNVLNVGHEVLKTRVDSLEEVVEEHEKVINAVSCHVCPTSGQTIVVR